MPQLQEATPETVERMTEHISHLHDAPIPEIAVIANTLTALICAHDFDYLLTLAIAAAGMSAKCLERLPAKKVLCGTVAPESEA